MWVSARYPKQLLLRVFLEAWRRSRPRGGARAGGAAAPSVLGARVLPLGSPRGLGGPVLPAQRSRREDRPWRRHGALGRQTDLSVLLRDAGSWACGPSAPAELQGRGAGHCPRGPPGPGVPGPQPAERRTGPSVSRAAPRRLGRWGALTALPLRSSLERGFLLTAGPEPGRVAVGGRSLSLCFLILAWLSLRSLRM